MLEQAYTATFWSNTVTTAEVLNQDHMSTCSGPVQPDSTVQRFSVKTLSVQRLEIIPQG